MQCCKLIDWSSFGSFISWVGFGAGVRCTYYNYYNDNIIIKIIHISVSGIKNVFVKYMTILISI